MSAITLEVIALPTVNADLRNCCPRRRIVRHRARHQLPNRIADSCI